MKPYISKLLILICAAVCLNACKGKTEPETTQSSAAPTNNEVNTKVVLKVGSEQFTVFELEKNFKMFTQKFLQTNHREPTQDDVKTWAKEFTERAYVLADAKAKGYYDRKDVKDEVESTATLMITQSHGLLEQKLTEKVPTQLSSNPADAQKAQMALVNNYQMKISKSAALDIDKPAVVWLQSVFNKDEKKNTVIRAALGNNLNKTLATYHAPNGKPAVISVEQFMNFYNNLPLRRYLEDTTTTIGYLHQMANNTYLVIDAEKMGITKDAKFKLSKKNYTENVVYQKYMQDNLGTTRGVTDSDIMAVYQSVKERMAHPTNIVYSLFTFSNQANAFKALGELRMKPNDTTLNLNSLSVKRHIKFDKDSKQLPDTLKKMIYRSAPGQPLPPIPTDDYFSVLLVESASGKEPFQPNEIKPYLTTIAKEKKELIYNSNKAKELSKKLEVKNDIDLKMFTNNRLANSLN